VNDDLKADDVKYYIRTVRPGQFCLAKRAFTMDLSQYYALLDDGYQAVCYVAPTGQFWMLLYANIDSNEQMWGRWRGNQQQKRVKEWGDKMLMPTRSRSYERPDFTSLEYLMAVYNSSSWWDFVDDSEWPMF
jgi:bisphosphoglycerate-dependent phosphoglycerate mutase